MGESTRETVSYSYDGLGQPFDLVGDETYVDDASWTVHGLPDLWTIGPSSSGTSRRWDYDAATLRTFEIKAGTTQLSGDTTRNLMRFRYNYDDSGNVHWIRDYRNSSQRECFEYDDNNRLTRAFTATSNDCDTYDGSTGSNPYDQSYSYDDLHNITGFDGTTHSYGTGNESGAGDAGPHAVVSAGSVTFAYDDNGNRISRTESSATIAYTYNDDNRLASIDLPSDPDDVVFGYDADGVRVTRAHGDHATIFIAGLMEIDLDDTTVTETRTLYAFAGTPVAVRTHEDAATVYVFDNHLGSVSAAWDDTNDTHTLQRYYPWGTDRGTTGTLPTDHRYTGQISDDTSSPSGGTGLLFYNARYYDPAIGAFVAADTMVPEFSIPKDFNRYAYVRANPLNSTDPTGHVLDLAIRVIGEHAGADPADAICPPRDCNRTSPTPYVEPAENYDPSWLFPWVGAGLVALGYPVVGIMIGVAPEFFHLLDQFKEGDLVGGLRTGTDIGIRAGSVLSFHRAWKKVCTWTGCKPAGVPLEVQIENRISDLFFDYRPEGTVGGSYLAPGRTPSDGQSPAGKGPGIGGGAIVLNL